jgi:hypothetical protein
MRRSVNAIFGADGDMAPLTVAADYRQSSSSNDFASFTTWYVRIAVSFGYVGQQGFDSASWQRQILHR